MQFGPAPFAAIPHNVKKKLRAALISKVSLYLDRREKRA